MTGVIDLGSDIAAALEGQADCWTFVQGYAQAWLRPLTNADRYGETDLAGAEERLGIRLPTAVREAYQLFGRRADLVRTQDHLLEPGELRFDPSGEVLIFRVECQHVAQWGIRADKLDVADPPVMFRYLNTLDPVRSGWRPYLDRFSLGCIEMTLSESMLHSDVSDNRELDEETIGILERSFARLPFPDYPLWAEPDGPPVRWFSDGDVLLRDDGRIWLWAHARTVETLDRMRAVLPGDWLMSEA